MKGAIRAFLIACLFSVNTSYAYTTAFALVDLEEDRTIISLNADVQAPIASITKMMTGVVFVRDHIDLDETVIVTGSHISRTGQLRRGMKVTRKNLLQLAMVSSDNLAAYSLAASYPGGISAMIGRMNEIARDLSMIHSEFVEPTGVLPGNLSTAKDIVLLTREAAKYDEMRVAATTVHGQFYASLQTQVRKIIYSTTNSFSAVLDLAAAKTGWTTRAGRCLTMIVNWRGRQYALVVLGAPNPQKRNDIINTLLRLI